MTVHCDLSHLYSVEGTFSDGRTLSEVTVPHYAIYNGERQDIFCIEPGVPIYNEFTPGYEKNPLPDMSEKAKLVSVLWKNAGTDIDTQMVAQKMIWQEANGYTLHSMKHPDGSVVNIAAIEAKINQAIADYQKKPSFHNSTANTVLGQSTTVTDTNNLNLSEFDEVVENTANIDYRVNGNQLVITPNANSKENGVLMLKKSAGTGTPVAYKMAGQQTLMAGAIDKPDTYTIKIDVETEGSLKIKKVDKESGDVVPGTVFHLDFGKTLPAKDGQAVKWSEVFKPELVKGTKASDETVTLTLDEKNQVAVKHLAINEYYWQETKAPEGYTLDETKYPVSIKKVDDSEKNAVITRDVTAKEQVIRFGFDFFKFAGSAAGTAETGFNNLTFKVSPLEGTNEITGAEDEATTAYNEQLGFDGYGKFKNLPYGDYVLEEIEAPEGFQKITPLEIRSTFKENKDDYAKSEYVFTITEKGQKQPIKTVTVPYEKLTNKEFFVSLNRLMLYDLPEEEDSLTSLATWKDGNKELTTLDSTELVDKLSYNLHEIKEDWYIVAQAIDVEATKVAQEKDEKAKPVVISETTTTLANKEKTGTWEILHKLTAEQVLDKTIVLFNYVYENKEVFEAGDEPVAKDASLNNQAQTVNCTIERHVSIQTKAHLEDGSQTFTHGDVVDMFDDVSITHDVLDGSKEAFETILYALLPDGTIKEIWKSRKIDYEVNDKEFTKTVLAKKVDTGKYPEGTNFTFTEINYDKDGTINRKHNEDLKEKSQTLTPKKVPTTPSTPEQPETPTVPSDSQESSPPVKTFPQTGEKNSNVLLFIGFTLIFATAGYYFWKHRN